MKKSLVYLSLTCLLVGLLSLVGCKKEEETTETTTPATTSAPATTEATSTEMGTGGAMGSDMGSGAAAPAMGTDGMGTGTTPPPAK